MANYREKLIFLDYYKEHKDKFLPLVDHAYKTFEKETELGDINLGWNVGLIGDNRPYFCEVWADGFTVATYFISTKGIEDYTEEQLEQMLEKERIIWYVGERKHPTSVLTFTDHFGNEFFSINIIVGDDDDTYVKGGSIYGFSVLNEYNAKA